MGGCQLLYLTIHSIKIFTFIVNKIIPIIFISVLFSMRCKPSQKINNLDLINAAYNRNLKEVIRLLKNNHSINYKDDIGSTALTYAAQMGNSDIVRVLLKNKADINNRDNYGFTPLIRAVAMDRKVTVMILLKNKADTTIKDEFKRDVYDWAKLNNKAEIIKILNYYHTKYK